MHPEGRFDAIVLATGVGWTPNGKLQVSVQLQTIQARPNDEPVLRQITARLSLEGDAVAHTKRKLMACGWDGKSFSALNADPSPCLDAEVSITVEHDEWEGQTRAQVGWIDPRGGGMGRDADAAAEADRLLGLAPKPAAKPMSKPAPKPRPTASENESPF